MSKLNGIHKRVNAEGKLEIEFCREIWDTIKSFDIAVPKKCLTGCDINCEDKIYVCYEEKCKIKHDWFCAVCAYENFSDINKDLVSYISGRVSREELQNIDNRVDEIMDDGYSEDVNWYLHTTIKNLGVSLDDCIPDGAAFQNWLIYMIRVNNKIRKNNIEIVS